MFAIVYNMSRTHARTRGCVLLSLLAFTAQPVEATSSEILSDGQVKSGPTLFREAKKIQVEEREEHLADEAQSRSAWIPMGHQCDESGYGHGLLRLVPTATNEFACQSACIQDANCCYITWHAVIPPRPVNMGMGHQCALFSRCQMPFLGPTDTISALDRQLSRSQRKNTCQQPQGGYYTPTQAYSHSYTGMPGMQGGMTGGGAYSGGAYGGGAYGGGAGVGAYGGGIPGGGIPGGGIPGGGFPGGGIPGGGAYIGHPMVR
jgi:hypothetical protein